MLTKADSIEEFNLWGATMIILSYRREVVDGC